MNATSSIFAFGARFDFVRNAILNKRLQKRLKNVVQSFAFIALVALVAVSCSTKTKPSASAATPRVWPPPPSPAQIAFVQTIATPVDLGIKRSGLSTFGAWITGRAKGTEAFNKPFGIFVDELGNLCVTDTGANSVGYFDRTKKRYLHWEKIGKLPLVSPVAIARKGDTLFIADSGLRRVLAFKENGKLLFQIDRELLRPTGLAITDDKIVVTDSEQHCICLYTLGGSFISKFGKRGVAEGEFNFPTHISVGRNGELLVTDSLNARIQIFDATGKFLKTLGKVGDTTGHLSRPKGTAVDSAGHIYVVDAAFDNFQIFDSAGNFLLDIGGNGTGVGEFWLPNGIAIGPENTIYVSDSYNRRVQVFKYVGAE